MAEAEIVGYFAWVRTLKGPPECEKYDAIRMTNSMPETKLRYQAITLLTCPLTAKEWKLPLDALAKIYPCPAQKKEV